MTDTNTGLVNKFVIYSHWLFLSVPIIVTAMSVLGVTTDKDGNNWGIIIIPLVMFYWTPIFLVLFVLRSLLSKHPDSKLFMWLSIVTSVLSVVFFINWILIGAVF